jgi:DNA-binding CsgD family transcriptional regulator
MIFNSKQLEELENIHDSTGAFEEEADEEGGFDEVGEAAMDWRRGLIEEAAENVKRAKGRPVESHLTYPIGSMLFEREARRFARVQRSVPGYLKIVYLSGGDREFGTLDVAGYLRDHGAEKRLSELAEQLGMSEGDVANELERLGITPVEEADADVDSAEADAVEIPPPPLPAGRGKRAAVVEDESEEDEPVEDEVEEASDEDEVVADDSDEGAPVVARGRGKSATPPKGKAAGKADKSAKGEKGRAATPAAPPSKAAAAKAARAEKAEKVPEPKAKAAKGSKAINPIDDPNGYIKANFQQMSNRELARFTGLSEHTIRRKLGEWGLKRKAP